MIYKNAHYVRHKFTGLYFRPGGSLSKKGKLYKDNNDILSHLSPHYYLTFECHDGTGDILKKLHESGVEPVVTDEYRIWNLPSGEVVKQSAWKTWDFENQRWNYLGFCDYFDFRSTAEHFERVPVKLTIEIGETE